MPSAISCEVFIVLFVPMRTTATFGFRFWIDMLLRPPEHVLRLVTADAEIQRMARRVAPLPNILARPEPALGDGIADEDDVAALLVDG